MFIRSKCALIALTVISINTMPLAVDAKPIGTQLTPDLRLLLARQKAQSNQNIKADDYIKLDDKRDDMFDENNSECGNVNIGNVHNDRPFGPQRPNITVVTGNVVNLGDDDC